MKRPASLNLSSLARACVTALFVVAAIWAGLQLWNHYEVEPWTRDGRVKAYVVQVAPDVSGLVSTVNVVDNASVQAGDVLFVIDAKRFELANAQAHASLKAAEVARDQAAREVKRNHALGDLVATEAREIAQSRLEQTRAQWDQAKIAVDIAELNLARAHVRAPAPGHITNLDLRAGAYVTAGRPVMALLEDATFYVEGYFEETKLAAIHVGDVVDVTPMGEAQSIRGHVESVAHGITDRDRARGDNLLPNVNPTFNWVRLAQRIPVRIAIDEVPQGMRLVAGQTATVAVREKEQP